MLCGAHVSSSGGIDTAIDRIVEMGGDCVQLFTQSPRTWRPTAHEPDAIERFRARRAEAGIGGVVCHALYLCNLAAPDREIYKKSVAAMRATVDTACAIGADAVVFHIGSHLGAGFEPGRRRVVSALKQILERCRGDTWLLMENSAGAGGTIGRSIAELALLVDALDRHPRLGVCLDSCHLWASGYDVTDAAVVDALVRELDDAIGLDRLRALHVNDSATPLGSNRDRHANLLEGLLGNGLSAFLAHPAFQQLDAYLEVPGVENRGPNAEEIEKLRRLHARAVKKKSRT
ncbi:MAG TPA: deoxyribonuclease IV [Gaiellaceae bacterium]|nr:deoxyribonuclease IV [Gaiellaceae bacterium]